MQQLRAKYDTGDNEDEDPEVTYERNLEARTNSQPGSPSKKRKAALGGKKKGKGKSKKLFKANGDPNIMILQDI